MTAYRFIEPLDVLYLRGNKLFGDPGSHGESLVPPWPSVAAGALRSRMLVDDGTDLAAFARGEAKHPTLGTPREPGSFTVSAFHLAMRREGQVQNLHPLPADLVATREGSDLQLRRLQPRALASGLTGSSPLGMLPVLPSDHRSKAESGLWLTHPGWQQYLLGELPSAGTLLASGSLWRFDPRVGVGLNLETRRADDGKLFSMQAVALVQSGQRIARGESSPAQQECARQPLMADYDVGFLAGIDGAEPPASGLLRLGGDGRAAAIHSVACTPALPDFDAIASTGRTRLVLTSPGLFAHGWRVTGCDTDDSFRLGGIEGRLVCAAVARAEVVSGWDVAAGRPKPALRAAPAGSVYWLDQLDATPEALRKLAARGLWPEQGHDAQRRAEGFNRFTWAAW